MSHKPITLHEITERSLRLLNMNLCRLEESMATDEPDEETGIIKFNVSRANAATGLARGLSSVLKEARALNKEAKEQMTNLGPTEKRRLIMDWFKVQPVEVQKVLVHEFIATLNGVKKNVG